MLVRQSILVCVVIGIACLAHWVDVLLRLPPVLFPALTYTLGVLLLFLGILISFNAYTYLVLEGRGSPAPEIKETTRLVTNGPYAVVRHPTVTGKLTGIFGVGLMFRSVTFLVVVYPLLVFAAVLSNWRDQEVPLLRRWEDAYRHYKRRVPMIVPRARALLALLSRHRWAALSLLVMLAATVAAGAHGTGAPKPWQVPGGLLLAVPLFLVAGLVGAASVGAVHGSGPGSHPVTAALGRGFVRGLLQVPRQGYASVVTELCPGSRGSLSSHLALHQAAKWHAIGTFILAGIAWKVLAGSSRPAAMALMAGLAAASIVAWVACLPLYRRVAGRGATASGEDEWPGGARSAALLLLALAQIGLELAACAALVPVACGEVPLEQMAWLLPFVPALARCPLTYNGAGAQEVGLWLLLGAQGVSPASAVIFSLLIHLARLPWRLLGGGLFLFQVSRVWSPADEDLGEGVGQVLGQNKQRTNSATTM